MNSKNCTVSKGIQRLGEERLIGCGCVIFKIMCNKKKFVCLIKWPRVSHCFLQPVESVTLFSAIRVFTFKHFQLTTVCGSHFASHSTKTGKVLCLFQWLQISCSSRGSSSRRTASGSDSLVSQSDYPVKV